MIPSPFRWISATARPRTLTVLLATTLCLSLVMSILGAPLKTPLSPRGIIDLELAGSAQLVGEYLAEWDLNTRLYLAAGLGFDYLYLVVYGLFFGLACHQMSEWNRHVGFFHRLGAGFAWGSLLAALLDAVENYALLRMVLLEEMTDNWAALAKNTATAKFSLLFMAVAYLLFGFVIRVVRPPHGKTTH